MKKGGGEECPRHLRATLANFRLYCQKNCNSELRLSYQDDHSKMTRYRGIRDIKIQDVRKNFATRAAVHPQDSPERLPFENIKPEAMVKMIKNKLSIKKADGQKLKTEGDRREEKSMRSNKKVLQFRSIFNSVQAKKIGKSKRIDLSITNTRCEIKPKNSLHPQKTKQVVVVLGKRPASASSPERIPTTFLGREEEDSHSPINPLCSKQGQHFFHDKNRLQLDKKRQILDEKKRKVEMEQLSNDMTMKELSGWQVAKIEEQMDWGEVSNKKCGQKKRRKKE